MKNYVKTVYDLFNTGWAGCTFGLLKRIGDALKDNDPAEETRNEIKEWIKVN